MTSTGLSYKKADKLIYGAVKNLTCILPESKNDWHEEQHYAVFWVSHMKKYEKKEAKNLKKIFITIFLLAALVYLVKHIEIINHFLFSIIL